MEDNPGTEFQKKGKPFGEGPVSGIMWWTTLTLATVAVPSFGFAISYIFPFRGILQLVVVILSCWLCTYIGMRLMENPRMSEMIRSDKEES